MIIINSLKSRTWAEVDLGAIEYNYRSVRNGLPAGTKVCCVVKANAYGHGAERVSKHLETLGADFFAVSNLDEAMQLRDSGINKPILILGYTPPAQVKMLASNKISQCIYSLEYANALAACAKKEDVSISVHLKIDVGMGRLGFIFRHSSDESLKELLDVCSFDCFVREGIFTHFPVADGGEEKKDITATQFKRFCDVIAALEEHGIKFDIKHCANSATALEYPEYCLDMVRAGIILYGALPSKKVKASFIPKSTIALKTVITNIKTVKKGDDIGYGGTFTAPRDMKVATLPIGYADGFFISNANNGARLLIDGRLCEVLGRVCMDQLMVNVDEVDSISIGDEAIVFGEGSPIGLEEYADINKTIPYEILCMIGARVPRIYKNNN